MDFKGLSWLAVQKKGILFAYYFDNHKYVGPKLNSSTRLKNFSFSVFENALSNTSGFNTQPK